jgi:ferrous iron transport protein A
MGLTRGSEITVIRRAPLGDPVEFAVKGYNLSLRRREAEKVLVIVEEKER